MLTPQTIFCLPVYYVVIVTSILYWFCSYLQVLCFGILVASAVAISNINDIFEGAPDGSDAADDRDKYRGVAGWLLFVGIAGLITQVAMAIIRGLYYGEIVTSQFIIFGITVSINFYIIVYTQIKATSHGIFNSYIYHGHKWFI